MNENLKKLIDARITMYQNWLKGARKTMELANYLPEEIQFMDIIEIGANWNNTELLVTLNGGDDAHLALFRLGITGFKSVFSPWSKEWRTEGGTLKLADGTTAKFTVHHTSKPPLCHMVKKIKRVTEYEAVCDKTGEKGG